MTQHPRCKDFYVSDYDHKWNVWSRDGAIETSQRMRHRCDKTVFYTDRGWSNGMRAAKKYCQIHGLPYEERTLDTELLEEKVSFCSSDFSQKVIGDESYKHLLE